MEQRVETNWEVCRKLIKNCGRATIAWPCYEVGRGQGMRLMLRTKGGEGPARWRPPCTMGRRHLPIKRVGSRRRQPAPDATWTGRKTFLLEAFWNKFAPCTLQTAWLLIPRHDSLPPGRLASPSRPRRLKACLAASKPGGARLHSGVVAGCYMYLC